jgi:hypothetical protein
VPAALIVAVTARLAPLTSPTLPALANVAVTARDAPLTLPTLPALDSVAVTALVAPETAPAIGGGLVGQCPDSIRLRRAKGPAVGTVGMSGAGMKPPIHAAVQSVVSPVQVATAVPVPTVLACGAEQIPL